jgi:multisubunit Na+/H+ antiporter MnhC subunit
MKKTTNQNIRKTSRTINFAGMIVLMLFVMFAAFRLLVDRAYIKEVLGVLVFGVVVFIFFRAAGWLVGGFEQKIIVPEPEPEVVPDPKTNKTSADAADDLLLNRLKSN